MERLRRFIGVILAALVLVGLPGNAASCPVSVPGSVWINFAIAMSPGAKLSLAPGAIVYSTIPLARSY